ncbi:MAG: leucine-rich repeat domain-containing protein [Candidatus Sericytochromatia bacterium]|nr:leucine-rich repeat domain-containing protein [Candidatus Sericytochromatia bacterium]
MPTTGRRTATRVLTAMLLLAIAHPKANAKPDDGFAGLNAKLSHPQGVTRLNIGSAGLYVDHIPDSVGRFSDLKRLDLFFKGAEMPPVLTLLPKLQTLNVYGSVTSVDLISRLAGLAELTLKTHALSLPEDLTGLTRLQKLTVSGTDLKTLPGSFTRLTALRHLDVTGTLLNPLPEPLWHLSKLEGLSLDSLQLSVIPPEIGKLGSLQYITMRDNALTDLPAEASRWARLESLSLNENRFRRLPESVTRLPRLAELDLTANELETLPETLSLPRLSKLYVGRNRLAKLPDCLTTATALTDVHVWSNHLTALTANLNRLKHLEKLLVRDNRLTHLPLINGLTTLSVLDADHNQLADLPQDLGAAKSLELLYVGFNRLKLLPDSINRLTALTELDVAGNALMQLPVRLEGLQALKYLVLSFNRLSSLSGSIGGLKRLERLYLNGNELTAVPDSLGGLRALEVLDLSDNHLTSLPASLGELQSLRILRVSDNQLVDLPLQLSKLKNLESLHIDNNPLSPAVIARLQRTLPRLHIVKGQFPWPMRRRDLLLGLLAHINATRAKADLAPLSWNALGTPGAEAHCRYLLANAGNPLIAGSGAHDEAERLPGYTKEGADDVLKAGSFAEVLAPGRPPIAGIDSLMSTILHRGPFIGDSRVTLGYASPNGRDGWLAARNVFHGDQYRSLAPSDPRPRDFSYPPDGATDVPLRMGPEIPNTTPNVDTDGICGFPFTLIVPGWLGDCEEMTATFTDAAGHVEPAWALTPKTCRAWGVWPDAKNHVMAQNPLKPGTRYTLRVQMRSAGGRTCERTIRFTTTAT